MAFDVKGEYERLIKIKTNIESKGNKMLFECGCVCGVVTRIEYIPPNFYDVERKIHSMYTGEEIYIYVDCFNREELALVLREHDVSKRYQDRKYRWNKKYKILESFAR